jgi:Mu transposase-like protein
VLTLAAAEPLAPLPAEPFPAILSVARTASAQALVCFRGNQYSVPPELARAQVSVNHRLGTTILEIATASGISAGTIIARHTLAHPGAGATIRDHGHVVALEHAAMAAFTPAAPHRRKQRIPPGPAARAAAATLRANTNTSTDVGGDARTDAQTDVVVDLARYVAAARGRNTLR